MFGQYLPAMRALIDGEVRDMFVTNEQLAALGRGECVAALPAPGEGFCWMQRGDGVWIVESLLRDNTFIDYAPLEISFKNVTNCEMKGNTFD